MSDIITEGCYYLFNCPHCSHTIQVLKSQVNCSIFRCGIDKKTMQPINPHLNQEGCRKLKEHNQIYGCAGPFRMDLKTMKVTICGYI